MARNKQKSADKAPPAGASDTTAPPPAPNVPATTPKTKQATTQAQQPQQPPSPKKVVAVATPDAAVEGIVNRDEKKVKRQVPVQASSPAGDAESVLILFETAASKKHLELVKQKLVSMRLRGGGDRSALAVVQLTAEEAEAGDSDSSSSDDDNGANSRKQENDKAAHPAEGAGGLVLRVRADPSPENTSAFFEQQAAWHNSLAPLAPDEPFPARIADMTSGDKISLLSHVIIGALAACKVPTSANVEVFPAHNDSLRRRCWAQAKFLLPQGSGGKCTTEKKPAVVPAAPSAIVAAVSTVGCAGGLVDGRTSSWLRVDEQAVWSYFGSETLFYVAWMNHYNLWLAGISLLGVALWASNWLLGLTNDTNHAVPFYSIVTMLWAVLFVKMWERRTAFLCAEYKLNHVEAEEGEIRKDYYGPLRRSPITGELERHYPGWKRMAKQPVSWAITVAFLAFSIVVQICSLNLQGYMNNEQHAALEIPFFDQWSEPGAIFDTNGPLATVPVVIHVVVILMLNMLYRHMAEALTTWENYRTQAEHEESLTYKRVFFEFIDCFSVLFYVAFYRLDLPQLRTELLSLYMVDQARRLFMESILPFLMTQQDRAVGKVRKGGKKLLRKASSIRDANNNNNSGSSSKKQPTLAEEKSTPLKDAGKKAIRLPASADVKLSEAESFDDYLEMTMQFGYVTLFAAAFPLAPLLSLIGNYFEIRSDLFKLCFVHRRSRPRPVRGIGLWNSVLKFFAFTSVITNTLLFSFTSNQMRHFFPALFDPTTGAIESGDGRFVIAIAFVMEHVLLILLAFLFWRIPSVPKRVESEIARRRHVKLKKAEGKTIKID